MRDCLFEVGASFFAGCSRLVIVFIYSGFHKSLTSPLLE